MNFNGKFWHKPGHLGMTTDEVKKALKALPTPEAGDAGKAVVVNADADGYELGEAGGGGGSENGPKIVGTIYFSGGDSVATIAANSVGYIRVANGDYTITGAYDYNNEEIPDLITKLGSGLYAIIVSHTDIGNDLHILGCHEDGNVTSILNMTNSSRPVANLDWHGILIRNYES